MKNEDKQNKPLISLNDLAPKEAISGGKNKGKRVFGSFNDDKKKNLPKDRF